MKRSTEAFAYMFVCLAVLLGSCAVGNWKCSARAERMGVEYEWGLLEGCMVKAPRGWIPIEGVRDIE